MRAGERCRRALCRRTARTVRCAAGGNPGPAGRAVRGSLPPTLHLESAPRARLRAETCALGSRACRSGRKKPALRVDAALPFAGRRAGARAHRSSGCHLIAAGVIVGAPALTRAGLLVAPGLGATRRTDRKSTRLNSSHLGISYAVFCL